MEEYFSAAAQSVAGLSYGGTRLWREYPNVISVDKRLNLLRKFKGMSSQNCPKTNERLEPCLTSVVSCWRIPIFPGRLQPSIFGTTELNFCVRNGNRWTLCVNLTNYPSMLSTDYCIIQASLCQVSTCLRSTCYVTLWKILFTRKVFSSASRSSQLFSCSFRSLAGCTFRDSNPGPTD